MKTWSIYDLATGRFTGVVFRGYDRMLAANLKPGQGYVEGEHDPLSERVELSTGFVVGYQPEAPDADHVWNPQLRRWELAPAVVEARAFRESVLAQIAALEASQPRALREFALGKAGATDRLADIERRISNLRQLLS